MSKERFSGSNKHQQSGQGIVEFALIIPLLLLIILGIFEVGKLMMVYFGVTSASREGARYGVASDESAGGTPQYIDCEGIESAILAQGSFANIKESDISISYDRGPGTSVLGTCPIAPDDIMSGDRIIVQVTGYFIPGPEVPLFEFPPISVSSTTKRTIIKSIEYGYLDQSWKVIN